MFIPELISYADIIIFKVKLSILKPKQTIVFLIFTAMLATLVIMSLVNSGSGQFTELAKAFDHGQLNFLSSIGGYGQDPVLYHGKIYWDEGPFPAILLMPFVWLYGLFHAFFYQNYLQFPIVLGVIYLTYKLARKIRYSIEDSLILMTGFVLGSVFIGVASVASSWLFAQAITAFLLLWSLYEYLGKKRWWLMGSICGMLVLTRISAAPIAIFFVLEILNEHKEKVKKILSLTKLLLPVVFAGTLVGLYNYLRFHNPFQGGYAYQLLSKGQAESRALGVVSPDHIPTNLYHMLLGVPDVVLKYANSWVLKPPYIKNNEYGLSIFFTSPYLLHIFTHKWSTFTPQARHLLIAAGVSCLFILSAFAVGKDQFGYRYSLDFLPELFLLFMIMYKSNQHKLSNGI